MTAPLYDAAVLKSQIDLRDIVRHHWGSPAQRAQRYDVHYSNWRDDGKKPAFTVYADRYKDYGGSGESGDIFAFLQAENNLTFPEAVGWVRAYLGLPESTQNQYKIQTKIEANSASTNGQFLTFAPENDLLFSPTDTASHDYRAATEPPPDEWQRAADRAVSSAQRYLWSGRNEANQALAYLRDIRGLNDETIRQMGYGYNPYWQKIKWVNPDTGKKPYLAPGIIEPWRFDGTLWAVRVRCRVGNLAPALGMSNEQGMRGSSLPRYLNLAGSRQSGALFNGDAVQPGGDVLIVEGGFDTALASQHVDASVTVVTVGSASQIPDASIVQKLQQANRIYLLLDQDAAGQSAQSRLAETLLAAHIPSSQHPDTSPKVISLRLPRGKDVTEYIIEHGGDLQRVIAAAGSAAWWPAGMPDTVRSALLNYFRDSTAPVVEMLNDSVRQGILNPESFTLTDTLAANLETGFCIADNTIRRVFSELEGFFLSKLETVNPKDTVPKFGNNRGRRAVAYQLLSLERVKQAIVSWAMPRIHEKHHPVIEDNVQIVDGIVARPVVGMLHAIGFTESEANELLSQTAQALLPLYSMQEDAVNWARKAAKSELKRVIEGLNSQDSTPLPENWPRNSAKAYRAAFLRATNQPHVRRSRREIADLLGIADSSVDATVHRAGLARAVDGGEYVLERFISPEKLSVQVKAAARELKGYPLAVVVEDENGVVAEIPYRGAETQAYMAGCIIEGASVSVRYQVANRYVEVHEEPMPAREKPVQEGAKQRENAETASKSAAAEQNRAEKSPKRSGRHYGPTYNPVWVAGQLKLALLLMGRVAYKGLYDPRLVDQRTGEILDDPSPRHLLGLLLPHIGPEMLEPDDPVVRLALQLGGVLCEMV